MPQDPNFNPNYNLQVAGTGTPISVSSLQSPTTPIQVTQPEVQPSFNVASLPPVDQNLQNDATKLGATETELSKSLREIMAGNTGLVGRSADQTAAEKAQGLPELQKTSTELGTQLKALQNEALAIPLQLQQEATGRGITTGGLQPIQTAALRNNAIKALGVSTLLSANQGQISTAQMFADKAVQEKYGPLEAEQKARIANLELLSKDPNISLEQKKRADAQLQIQKAKEEVLKQQKQEAKDIYDISIKAAQFGAPASVLQQLQNAKSPEEALTIAGQYLGAEFKAQMAQQKLENDIRRRELELKEKVDAGNDITASTADDLTKVLGSSKIAAGTKTNIGNILGVINASETLANNLPGGKVAGYYPGASIVNVFTPKGFKRDSTIKNEGFIDAINLKVQQWASGASLTKQQIDQVNKLVPSKDDTDRTFQVKLTNLVNFMNQQIKGSLASEGVSYNPETVDLFNQPQTLEDIFK